MTTEAHVIVFVDVPDGWHTTKRLDRVVLGTEEQAQAVADALNKEHGYAPDEDGDWWSEHYTVTTVPLVQP